MELTTTEKRSLIPSALSALVLFLCLVYLIPGAGNILISSIISVVAYPIIILFSCIGISASNKVRIKSKLINGVFNVTLGIILGLIGYVIANSVLYMQGTIFAFLASGAVAGLLVSLNATAKNV